MSCPRWDRLVAFRYEGPEAHEPEGWAEALEHLDGCPACREEAFAADPTLLFRRLPEEPLAADEVRSLRAGVDTLRRASEIESPGRGAPARRRARAGWLSGATRAAGRLAAAAALAAALLSVHPDGVGIDGGTSAAEQPTRQARAAAWSAPVGAVLAGDEIESPTASVYHFDEDDVAITMVVDPDFDV